MTVSEFINELFKARQNTHEFHLKTQSYARHIALGDFYDELLDLADEFTETYQGKYGLLELPKEFAKTTIDDPATYIAYFANFLKENRVILEEDDTHLQNIIDEIVSLTYRTLYKLRYLQ